MRRDKPQTDKDFIGLFKEQLSAAGMGDAELKQVSNHSFRAGGATDCFVAGLTAEMIKQIGGWRTYSFLVYIRPAGDHKYKVAARFMQALRAARAPRPSAAS